MAWPGYAQDYGAPGDAEALPGGVQVHSHHATAGSRGSGYGGGGGGVTVTASAGGRALGVRATAAGRYDADGRGGGGRRVARHSGATEAQYYDKPRQARRSGAGIGDMARTSTTGAPAADTSGVGLGGDGGGGAGEVLNGRAARRSWQRLQHTRAATDAWGQHTPATIAAGFPHAADTTGAQSPAARHGASAVHPLGTGTSTSLRDLSLAKELAATPLARPGYDFRRLQWDEPDEGTSLARKEEALYQMGAAPLDIDLDELGHDMGEGVQLHFEMLSRVACALLAMTLLAAPIFIAAASGARILPEKMDALGIGATTIGNIGFAVAFEAGNSSSSSGSSSSTGPGVTVDDDGEPMVPMIGAVWTLKGLANLITAGEFMASCVFLLTVVLLRFRISRVASEVDDMSVTAQDYSVQVQGLPPDATEAQVRAHFSRLYPLDEPDWEYEGCLCYCRRKVPRVAVLSDETGLPLRPVANVSNTGDDGYAGSWVAEVSAARREGRALRQYKVKQRVLSAVVKARARVQMHNAASARTDPAKMASAEWRLAKVEAKLAAAEGAASTAAAARREARARECVGAFVVFNHIDSRERCLADYAGASARWTGACSRHTQPPPLRFRGTHPLQVTPAPDPTDLLWENLETSPRERALRRLAANMMVALLLSMSLVVLYATQRQKATFAAQLPQPRMCAVELPAVAYGGYDDVPVPVLLERDRERDDACGDGRFFLAWVPGDGATYGGTGGAGSGAARVPSPAVARVDSFDRQAARDAAAASKGDLHADYADAGTGTDASSGSGSGSGSDPQHQTPASLADACSTHCIPSGAASGPGSDTDAMCTTLDGDATYALSASVGCYCLATMQRYVVEHGVVDGARALQAEETDVCAAFAKSFVLSNALFMTAALAIVVINQLLLLLLKKLVRLERHDSVSHEQRSLTTSIFMSLLINTGALTVLVNMAPPGGTSADDTSSAILTGAYSDFTPEWYSGVGASIVAMIAVQAVVPHLTPVLKHVCLRRCAARCCGPCARAAPVTQEELDLRLGPTQYELGLRTATFLNVVSCALMFSGGMPVLLPIAALGCALQYAVDKWTLLRLSAQPPRYDAALARMATTTLLRAWVVHVAITSYMFGAAQVFPSSAIDATIVSTVDGAAAAAAGGDESSGSGGGADSDAEASYSEWRTSVAEWDTLSIMPRLAQLNVFPLAILLALVLVTLLAKEVLGRGLAPVLRGLLHVLRCRCCGNGGGTTGSDARYLAGLGSGADAVPGTPEWQMYKARCAYTEPYRGYVSMGVPELTEVTDVDMEGETETWVVNETLKGMALSNEDVASGWQLVTVEPWADSDGVGYCYKQKRWEEDGEVRGVPHEANSVMLTWEVMRHAGGLHTYVISENGRYKRAVVALAALATARARGVNANGNGGVNASGGATTVTSVEASQHRR